jgi:hypothetical protein
MTQETRFMLTLVLGAALSVTAAAQTARNCADLPATLDDTTVVVDALIGQAVFQPAEGAFPLGGIDNVCIAILDDKSMAAVSKGHTDARGKFDLALRAPGNYILVADHAEFGEVATRVRIRGGTKDSASESGLLILFASRDQGAGDHTLQITHLELRRELVQMFQADQDIRNKLIQAGMASPDPVLQARMGELDAANTTRLQEIVAEYGWPDPALVGFDGAEAAFTLLQHAEYVVQKQLYPLLEAAYKSKRAAGQSYALLTDRILVKEGKPQIYGTQARPTQEWVNREPVFFDIEDEANVDQRRAEVGLPPLAKYTEMIRTLYFPAGQPKQTAGK